MVVPQNISNWWPDSTMSHTIKLKSSLFCLVCGDRVQLRMILSGCINVWTVCTSEYTMVNLLNCIFGQRSHILNLRRSSNMYANCNSSGTFSAIYLIISVIVWFMIYVFGFCNICSDKNSAGWLQMDTETHTCVQVVCTVLSFWVCYYFPILTKTGK